MVRPDDAVAGADVSSFVVPEVRLAELEIAVNDPLTDEEDRALLVGLRDHLAAFERAVDTRLPVDRTDWYVRVVARTEPMEIRTALVLRRRRAGSASARELRNAVVALRRILTVVMSEASR